MRNLFVSFFICLAVDMAVSFIFTLLGYPSYVVDIVTCFVLSLTFSILDYRKLPGKFWLNPKFHAHFASLFVLLLVVTYVIGYVL